MNEKDLKNVLKKLKIETVSRNGYWLQFSCPFAKWTHRSRKDNSPSCGARVNNEGVSSYKCFTCHKSGRISSLVRSLEYYSGRSFPGVALEADLADATISFGDFEKTDHEEFSMPEPLNEAAYADLYMPAYENKFARQYLKQRGVSKETAEYLGLGYDPDDLRITFPVRDIEGNLYGFTGRSILPDDKFSKMYKEYKKVRDYLGLPKKFLMLGAEFIDPKKPNFVIEGLFGYTHLFEIHADNICNPLAVLGNELTNEKADFLIEQDNLTILAFDNDDGGDSGLFGVESAKYAKPGAVDKLSGHIPIVVPNWPKGKKDPDELTLAEVRKMINQPLWKD